jgi:hypothetical protein
MANWNPKRDPEPDKKDVTKFKDFLKFKYVDKRFTEENNVEDDSSDEETKKRKKDKKKDKKKKKVVSSSDSESDEIVTPAK